MPEAVEAILLAGSDIKMLCIIYSVQNLIFMRDSHKILHELTWPVRALSTIWRETGVSVHDKLCMHADPLCNEEL